MLSRGNNQSAKISKDNLLTARTPPQRQRWFSKKVKLKGNLVIIVAMIYGDPCLKHFSVLKVTATKLALRRKKNTSNYHAFTCSTKKI